MPSSCIPEKMQAAQVMEWGATEYKINNVDVPKPRGFEYLVKIGAVGNCHTDSMVANGDYKDIGNTCPITGSHEPLVTIVAMGPDAERLGKHKIGDRVGSYYLRNPCGKCADCTVFNDPTYCTDGEGCAAPSTILLNEANPFAWPQAPGLTLNGGFIDYCLLDARMSASLPDAMSLPQAASLMCAGLTIHKAIRQAEEAGSFLA